MTYKDMLRAGRRRKDTVGAVPVFSLDGDLLLLFTRLMTWVVESAVENQIRRLIISFIRASLACFQDRDGPILLLLLRSLLPFPHRCPSTPTSS